MATIELYHFRFRNPVTGRAERSRYKAERRVIMERYPDAEVIEGTRELREVPDLGGSAVIPARPARTGL